MEEFERTGPVPVQRANPILSFLFDLVFPTAPIINIAVFLFLLFILGFSYMTNYVVSDHIVKDFSGNADLTTLQYAFQWTAALLIMAVPLVGMLAVYIFTFAISRRMGMSDVSGRASNAALFPGFSLLIYLLVYFGHVVSRGDSDWLVIGLVFLIMAATFGMGALRTWAEGLGLYDSSVTILPSRAELLLGLAVSGFATLFFLLQDVVILDAVIRVYGIFITSMIFYRLAMNVFGPNTTG